VWPRRGSRYRGFRSTGYNSDNRPHLPSSFSPHNTSVHRHVTWIHFTRPQVQQQLQHKPALKARVHIDRTCLCTEVLCGEKEEGKCGRLSELYPVDLKRVFGPQVQQQLQHKPALKARVHIDRLEIPRRRPEDVWRENKRWGDQPTASTEH
jgi:hypothetical protein